MEHRSKTRLSAEGLTFAGFRAEHELGRGRFASVWNAVDAAGNRAAVKVFRNERYAIESFKTEARFMREIVDSEFVTKFMACGVEFQFDTVARINPWIVMRAEGCSVDSLLKYCMDEYECAIPMPKAREIAIGLFRGLDFLKKAGIVHSDIKPNNILIGQTCKQVDDGEPLNIRIADFGSATRVGEESDLVAGTIRFNAPELVADGDEYDTSVDIWSAGPTIYEMITGESLVEDTDDDDECENAMYILECILGKPPRAIRDMFDFYDDEGKIAGYDYPVKRISISRRLTKKHGLEDTSAVVDLILACMRYNPAERISVETALSCGWLAQ